MARARPKRARLALEGHIQHRGTDETHISCATYAKPGSSVPERCPEHRRDGDVLIVDVCGHDGCTKRLALTRSAEATCDGEHGYCPEHGKDRSGYYRCAAERCYGGDGKCKDHAPHRRVAGADGAGAAGLCSKHLAGLSGAAQKQYARSSGGCDNCTSGQRCYERRDGDHHCGTSSARGAGAGSETYAPDPSLRLLALRA